MCLGVMRGSVAVFGDFIAADAILPARHAFLLPGDAALHLLEALGPEAGARVRRHSILVVGEAFGYGTGRESPARALRAAGVKALVGVSFARMFYRNAINNGILPIVCGELLRCGISDGDEVEIDAGAALLRWNGQVMRIPEVPALLQQIVLAGDLIAYGRNVLRAAQAAGRS
ncbi:MAG: 3-isopropylmalate dehydratase small subunit [Betaproteobacteria bacterium]|nr:3-isopropylmalate dehydratase small subunit [Betaproteobacteria bacterium]